MGAGLALPKDDELVDIETAKSMAGDQWNDDLWNKNVTDGKIAFGKLKELATAGPLDFSKFTGVCCVDSNPDNYKVVAELPQARLVEMTLAPGQKDKPHDHPVHHMYVISGAKLSITHPNPEKPGENVTDVIELPTGAAPILPAGPHCVENVGDTVAKIIFIEAKSGVEPFTASPTCAGFISPFDVYQEGYKKLNEDDDWFCGEMTLGGKCKDVPHSHNEHLVYVLEGEAIAIMPIADMKTPDSLGETMEVPIKPGMALPVPQGHHIVENKAGVPCKMIFFERKK